MPVYNGEDFLEKTCESLFKQTLKDIELICVNDGSTDKSVEILKDLKKEHDCIRIINQENQGSGKARNNGLDNAKGEYIAFLDADDFFLDEDALEKMYEIGKKNNADMIGANMERVSPTGTKEGNFNYKEGNYAYFDKEDVIDPEDYGIPWAFYKNIFKRDLIEEHNIRFPDYLRGQDPVFLSEILVNIDKIYTIDRDLYGYNYSIGGGANNKINTPEKKYDYMMHFKDSIQILEDAGYYDAAVGYKEQIVQFVSINRRFDDKELLEIMHNIFMDGLDANTFKTLKEEVQYLRLALINPDIQCTLEYSLQVAKNNLFRKTITSTSFIHARIMEKYIELKAIEKENKGKKDPGKFTLTADDMDLDNIKETIINSESWRLTSPFRALDRTKDEVVRRTKGGLMRLW